MPSAWSDKCRFSCHGLSSIGNMIPQRGEIELGGPSKRTVAELYARERGPRLDTYERRLIEAINRKPYSFYEVLEVEPGRRIFLQDVLAGSRIMVQERTGSRHVKQSDIVFGRGGGRRWYRYDRGGSARMSSRPATSRGSLNFAEA